jgi:hypothetical protein
LTDDPHVARRGEYLLCAKERFSKKGGYGTLFCFQRLTRTSYQMPSCGKGSLPAANRIFREDRLLMEVASEPDGEKVLKRRSCVKHDHVLITHARSKS